jgi:hypothetical protein
MFILCFFLVIIIRMRHQNIIFFLFFLSISATSRAETDNQWNVMKHTDTDSGLQMRVATIENGEGFKLEIYRDTKDVIRIRFNIRDSYDLLARKQCPTFQVDDRKLANRSINDAPCISQPRWAEYVMGYVTDDKVFSLPLHNLMNGNSINYRFLLKNGNYGETSFSLSGSKSILNTTLGKNLEVITKPGQ